MAFKEFYASNPETKSSFNTKETVCIAVPFLNVTSETFILDHISHLPFDIQLLHGKRLHLNQQSKSVAPYLHWRILDPILRRLRLTDGSPLVTKGQIRFFQDKKVRAVLAEFGPTGARLLPACRKLKLPLIVHFHGYDAYQEQTLRQMKARYRELFSYSSAIISVSKDMTEQLTKLGAPTEKIAYIPCGADTTVFKGASPDKSAPKFLAVGRFVEKKGPSITLTAFSKVLQRCPDARLVMIGDGPLLESCKRLVDDLQISQSVEFMGEQHRERVLAEMKNARAFVQHSVRSVNGDSEGTPVAIVEAQSTGLPVVATRHAGIKDVVLEDESGILVDEFDCEGMTQGMIKLALDANLADRMGCVGRERICSQFSLSHSIQKLTGVIRAALDQESCKPKSILAKTTAQHPGR